MARKKRMTTADVLADFKKAHGDGYDYSKVEYVNTETKVTIGCKACGHWFEQKPAMHKRGQGCKRCAVEKNKKGTHTKGAVHANPKRRTGYPWYDLIGAVFLQAHNDIKTGYNPMKDTFLGKEDKKSVIPAKVFIAEAMESMADLARPSHVVNKRGREVPQ